MKLAFTDGSKIEITCTKKPSNLRVGVGLVGGPGVVQFEGLRDFFEFETKQPLHNKPVAYLEEGTDVIPIDRVVKQPSGSYRAHLFHLDEPLG